MAKMANGLADDLASAVLLATDKKILLAPAMNPQMWANKATRRNLAQLVADGVAIVGPNAGEMAESGEAGVGRMAEPLEIVAAAQALLAENSGALAGIRMLVTSGPTHEPIDPVRYIANRSSGKQGHAIAEAAARRRRRCDVDLRAGECARSARREHRARSKSRATCWPRSRRRCRPMSRCLPPRSPTGARRRTAARRSRRAARARRSWR